MCICHLCVFDTLSTVLFIFGTSTSWESVPIDKSSKKHVCISLTTPHTTPQPCRATLRRQLSSWTFGRIPHKVCIICGFDMNMDIAISCEYMFSCFTGRHVFVSQDNMSSCAISPLVCILQNQLKSYKRLH